MNTFKAALNKLILGLTSVGILILLMFPVSLYASHFRYGTMSWHLTGDDNATHTEIRLYLTTGWRTNVGDPFDTVGETATRNPWNTGNYIDINWGDGQTTTGVTIRTTSIDTAAGSSNAEIGTMSGGVWTPGVTHSYYKNGTYIVSWVDEARISNIENMANNSEWRLETKVNLEGQYVGNVSPVSAVPPIVQIQDNTSFNYQLVSTDANQDTLGYRWGTYKEFVDNTSSTTYLKPTGMTLSSSGLVQWNVLDSGGQATDEGDMWLSFIMVEDLDSISGDNKSYIPIDFFFKIASALNDPPEIFGLPTTTQTVTVGTTKTFTVTSTDDSGVAPTVSVLNPPSDNSSIWSTTTSTSGSTTTFKINFSPVSSMDNSTYAVNLRSTDNASMTKDQSFGLKVSSISNDDPTAPILLSPADNSTVTEPVTFQWKKSTDPDGDTVSYKIYICSESSFAGCSGASVTAGVNFVPPFNQIFHDNLILWPNPLHAATVSQQISQDPSMIPKWVILLSVLGLLSGFISLSVNNITHRRIVFMFIFLTFCLSLTIISCGESEEFESWEKGGYSPTVLTYTTSDLTTNTTYYWKVIASETRGGSAESETWSFKVK